MNYSTYIDADHLPRLRALHHSLQQHCQPYTLWVLALSDGLQLNLPNVITVPLSLIETPALQSVRPSRQWNEYLWTLKPSWMCWLYDNNSIERLTHIDSDGFFFADLSSLLVEIGSAPLAITPHRLSPGYEHYIVNGIYNGGFVYTTRSGLPCLRTWAADCLTWCYLRHNEGERYGDQKYLNVWPERWDAHSILHKGINLAPWNQAQYTYSTHNGRLYVDDDPIVWYHFHGNLAPGYPIHPFIQQHVYAPYARVLEASC